MKAIRDQPLQRKVMLIIGLVSAVTLVTACGALFAFQLLTFRANFERDLAVLADVTANSSTAALAFRDQPAAVEILAALQKAPLVLSASIQTPDGGTFARCGQPDGHDRQDRFPQGRGLLYHQGHLLLAQPIVLDGRRIGSLRVCADYQGGLSALLKLYTGMMALVLAGSLALAMALSLRLQRLVSRPILKLVSAAKHVAESEDYSVRAEPADQAELGLLTDAFNQMLSQIQARDAALQQARDLLEHRVKERTAQLRKLSQAVEQSPVSIVITNAAGEIEYVNPKFTLVTGYAPDEVRGHNPRLLKSGEMAPEEYRRMWQTISGGQQWRGEFHNRRKNGELYWEDAYISPILDEAGRITHFVAIKEDITERKRAEAERAAMQLQLQQAQKLESIGRLAAGIAHEINTPTQYIGDNIRFLQEVFTDLQKLLEPQAKLICAAWQNGVAPELLAETEHAARRIDLDYLRGQIPKAIAQSLEGVSRVTHIVRAMKDFSHPGSTQKTAVNLNRAIASSIEVARNEWKYVAEMVTDFDPTLPEVVCLPGELNQVVLNLILNAAHAIAEVVGDGTGGRGTIRVATRRDGDWAEIRVRDTGPGIAQGIQHRIFEPFFTTKPMGKGTGQGLAMARAVVVNRHGGNIRFESEPGQGTTFVVRLPLQPLAANETETLQARSML